MNKLPDTSHFFDLSGLDSLRQRTQEQDKSALKEVAQQFEAIFVQMVMKSMRAANAAFESDSPMNHQSVKFYQQMHDQQLSVELGAKGVLGLSDLMVQQLSGNTDEFTPSSILRSFKTPNGIVNNKSHLINEYTESLRSANGNHFAKTENFIQQLFPLAKDAANKLGVSPQVLLAQSALETGWGKNVIKHKNGNSSFNLFNIKADNNWTGDKVNTETTEYENNEPLTTQAFFRSYSSYKDSFNDFVNFIKNNPRYKNLSVENAHSFIKSIKNAGYATDPNYVEKVMSVMGVISQKFNR